MDKHLKAAEYFVNVMENQFVVGRFRFGLDPLIGLVPGLGDALSAILAFYLVWIGYQMRLPGEKLVHMVANIVLDFLAGSIPLVGDAVDFVFTSNSLNLKILKDHVGTVIDGEVIN